MIDTIKTLDTISSLIVKKVEIRGHAMGMNKNPIQTGVNFGSIRLLKSGKVQARYTAPDGKRYNAPATFDCELDAWLWLGTVRDTINAGNWEPPRKEEKIIPRKPERKIPTVGELVQEWLKMTRIQTRTGELRETTLVIYTSICEHRILNDEQFSSIRVDRLTSRDVAEWWEGINTRYPDTKDRNKKAYSKLRCVIWIAVEYGYLNHNPVHLSVARKRPRGKRKNLPTTQQLHSILDHVPERLKLVTCLTLFHGLRTGEALALKPEHIQPTGRGGYVVEVAGNLQRIPDDKGHVSMVWQPPKTEAGYRTVPVFAEFNHVVENHLYRYGSNPNLYLTRTRNDKPLMDTSFRSSFHLAKKKAGAPEEITPHYGRNWLITRLAETGATPKEIGRILGQEDVSTIVGVYMKVRESRPAELMSRVSLSD